MLVIEYIIEALFWRVESYNNIPQRYNTVCLPHSIDMIAPIVYYIT